MDAHSSHKVENANHDKVLYYIDKTLSENPKYCRCLRCRLDVTALALNMLPPHYFVNPSHSQAEDLGSPWLLIEVAVREALERINRNPHHELKEREFYLRPNYDIPPFLAAEEAAEG